MRKIAHAVALAALLSMVTGCSLFVPAHPRSYIFKGEKVSVELTTEGASASPVVLKQELRLVAVPNGSTLDQGMILASGATYPEFLDKVIKLKESFRGTTKEPTKEAPAKGAPAKGVKGGEAKGITIPPGLTDQVLGLAVDAAVNLTQKQLEKEAGKYEDQFKGQVLIDGFLKYEENAEGPSDLLSLLAVQLDCEPASMTQAFRLPSGWRLEAGLFKSTYEQQYTGLTITRTTEGYPSTNTAFRLTCRLRPSEDQQVWAIEPVSFQRQAAKCKVLHTPLWNPLAFFNPFLEAKNQVETTVNLEWTAISRQQKDKDPGTIAIDKVASYSFDLPTQDLDTTTTPIGLGGKQGGWFPVFPVSYDYRGVPVGVGTGILRIVVTERDKSNAKKYLERAADEVVKRQDDIKKGLTSMVGGTEQK